MSVKNELLKALEENRGKNISGQELANELHVSRNAIWKAVKSLQEEGYLISAGTNSGYCLSEDSDKISTEGISFYLTDNPDLKVYVYDTIDSTNDEAKRRLAAGERENLLVVAKEQTGGHGRRGRSFYSPKETGIYMSVLVHTDAGLEDAVSITTATSVIVAKVISSLTGKKPQIKWVNDVYLDGKKICGILTEAILNFESGDTPGIIVGVGINVSTEDFPEEVKSIAGNIKTTNGVTKNQIIAAVTEGICKHARNVKDTSYLKDYRELSMVIGKDITYTDGEKIKPAKAIGIDDRGGLIIELENHEMKVLSSGEISIRVINPL